MDKRAGFSYEIQCTKAADKFQKTHEDVRTQYEDAIRELLVGEHPEKVDVKRIRGKRNDYYRIKLGGCRVVYAIVNGKIVVISTLLAGPRGDVYKNKRSEIIRKSYGMKHPGEAFLIQSKLFPIRAGSL